MILSCETMSNQLAEGATSTNGHVSAEILGFRGRESDVSTCPQLYTSR